MKRPPKLADRTRRRQPQRSSTARGYGYDWQQLRKEHLRDNPLCVCCEAKGKRIRATTVDHITPHRGNESLRMNRKNLQSLCSNCHDSDKGIIERRFPDREVAREWARYLQQLRKDRHGKEGTAQVQDRAPGRTGRRRHQVDE